MKHTRLYIIPGLGESTRAKNYREIIKYARGIGLRIVPVNIKWSSKMDMTDFISQVDKKIPDSITNNYILGFSFGAYIAAVLTKKKAARGYIFCSTSPYFKENLKDIPDEAKKYFGEKMFKSFKKYSFPKDVKSGAWFLIGENDWEIAVQATEKAYKNWIDKKNISIIKNTGHELSNTNYTKRVKKILKLIAR